jgi:hypothetical protein
MTEWLDIKDARKDGTRYLVKIKDRSFLFSVGALTSGYWADTVFVALHRGNTSAWQVAAPVGCGGFPDSWILGYQEIPGITELGPWEPWEEQK